MNLYGHGTGNHKIQFYIPAFLISHFVAVLSVMSVTFDDHFVVVGCVHVCN